MSKVLLTALLATLLTGCYSKHMEKTKDLETIVQERCNSVEGTLVKGATFSTNGITPSMGVVYLCLPKGKLNDITY